MAWNQSLQMADLDGDSKPDIVVSSTGLRVLLNRGGGSFGPALHFAEDTTPNSVAVGDIDGDGQMDLVIVEGTSVVVFQNSTQ